MDLLNLMGNKPVVLDDTITLPYENGKVIEHARLPNMRLVLCHFPDRGPPWSTDGQYVCWIVHPVTGCVAGIYETSKMRAVSLFKLRLKKLKEDQ
jgi:hypothetical protein